MLRQRGEGEFEREFSELRLPMALVDLDEFRIVAVTPSVVLPDGRPAQDVIGLSVFDVIARGDHERARLALDALAGGAVDFARVHSRLNGLHEQTFRTLWLAAVELSGRRAALVQIATGDAQQVSPLETYLGTEPVALAVGTLNSDWVITNVSSGVELLLGIPAEDMIGRVLLGTVERGDVDRVLRAFSAAKDEFSVGLSVRMRSIRGWEDVQVVLGRLADSTKRFFIVTPGLGSRSLRALKLEQHLRRIAAEVQASGVLELAPSTSALPELAGRGSLTPRQWEVLTRLLRGERIPTIARELFLSESTVRNHLSAIYSRMGVKSQAELMALAVDGGEPPT